MRESQSEEMLMTSGVAEADLETLDSKEEVAETVKAQSPRITGSFATRLLQKALDDRKKTDPNLKVPELAGVVKE